MISPVLERERAISTAANEKGIVSVLLKRNKKYLQKILVPSPNL